MHHIESISHDTIFWKICVKADIRNPLRYLLIAHSYVIAYQQGSVSLLIQDVHLTYALLRCGDFFDEFILETGTDFKRH